MPSIHELESNFGINNTLHFEEVPGGLVKAVIKTPLAEAEIYLHGAHITHWTPAGQRPVLFLSKRSLFTAAKAIRGGVPIIFPWFGARTDDPNPGGKPSPAHGFARNSEWTLESTGLSSDGTVSVLLSLPPSESTRFLGFDHFRLYFTATFGTSLEMDLVVHNDGAQPIQVEDALHTYLSISGIDQVSVTGLANTTYIDKTDKFIPKVNPDEFLHITKETDSLYLDTQTTCIVHDSGWNRRIVVEKSGSSSTVVWNPWIDKTAGFPDMLPDEWKEMICVETCNAATNAINIQPGGSHTTTSIIRIE